MLSEYQLHTLLYFVRAKGGARAPWAPSLDTPLHASTYKSAPRCTWLTLLPKCILGAWQPQFHTRRLDSVIVPVLQLFLCKENSLCCKPLFTWYMSLDSWLNVTPITACQITIFCWVSFQCLSNHRNALSWPNYLLCSRIRLSPCNHRLLCHGHINISLLLCIGLKGHTSYQVTSAPSGS